MSKIKILDNFFDDEDLLFFNKLVESEGKTQTIREIPEISKKVNDKYKDKLNSIGVTSIEKYVSISCSNSGVGRHKDEKLGDYTHKILIYLNDVPNGGTIIFDGGKDIKIENKANKLVLFDISLEHMSEKFDMKYKKKAIGFRPIMA